ncbi:site-specific integrase [Deinococcus sp. HMF7604]|uniref:tyrosine-type recombinase/integrase n=1 Tax=Deinococcus betulae TaxID=2873312 RepID=UPI001CC97777|nr:tyrosine-type recombinase/integrase [Deinococcus betulae]MBZ9750735.1 site-specific integrase [Deinococcus betulae]
MTENGGKRAKRGQGEGSFTALPDGRVRWRVMVTTDAGERRHFSGTAKNLTAARAEVREARKFKEYGDLPPREVLTVEQLITEYIDARERSGAIKGRSVKDYHYSLRHYIAPSLGPLKAQGVNAQRLKDFYAGLASNGERTRGKIHALIRAAYRWGMREGRVMADPTVRGRPERMSTRGPARPEAFTPDEAVKFYEAARTDRWGWPLAFMLATGLRPGEALALTWADVTFRPDGSAVVKVGRTRSAVGGKVYEDTPKTHAGTRTVTVTGSAVQVLRDSEAQQERERGARLRDSGRSYTVTPYVFTSRAGTPWHPDNLRRPMGKLCAAAGVTALSPHKLRHSYASLMAARGVPVEVLSSQLGHSSASVTRDVYRHVYDVEREGLTFDPVPPASREVKRVTVKAKRMKSRAAEVEPAQDTPSAAHEARAVKERGRA